MSALIRIALAVFTLMLAAGASYGEDAESLSILVYGATGKVGSHVVSEALNRGHAVTAVSRDPSRIQQQHQNLSAVKGDLLDTESIASLAAEKDVIIVSVRGIIGKEKNPENAIQYIAAKNIVDVLSGMGDGAPRLIHVGGSGSLEVEPGVLYADRIPKLFLPKSLELEIRGQILTLEYLRTVSDVNWAYATPAKNFTNGERTGVFRIGGDTLLEDAKGKSRISRADFAVALVDEAEKAEHMQKRFSVVY